MKIEHKAVLELLDQITFLTDGIIETVKCGDDGFLFSIEDQRNDIRKLILDFRSKHLTKEETIAVVGKYNFISEGDRLSKRPKNEKEEYVMDSTELTNWVRYLCYNYLKKAVQDNPITPEMNEIEIRNHIDLICCDWKFYRTYEKGFFNVMFDIVCLITDEIMEHRKQNQQLTLL